MLFPTAGQLLVLGLVACASAQEVPCWAPDGKTRSDNDTYVPCNKLGIQQNDVFSMCCALDGTPEDRDICSASGLCSDRQNRLTRAYCTDKTWKSDACLKICIDDNDNGNSTGPSVMTPCNDGTGKYCCGGSTQCCGTAKAVSIPLFQDSVCHGSSDEEDAAALSTWRSATIGLAAALGVTLLAALASTVWMARQNKTLKKKLAARPDTAAAGGGGMMQQHHGAHTPSIGHAAQFQHPHYTGSTQQHHSPLPEHGHMYKPSGGGTASPPPMHSPQSETFHQGNVHRYSELDAAATARSEMASPPPDAGGLTNARGTSPRPDSYIHADPMSR